MDLRKKVECYNFFKKINQNAHNNRYKEDYHAMLGP